MKAFKLHPKYLQINTKLLNSVLAGYAELLRLWFVLPPSFVSSLIPSASMGNTNLSLYSSAYRHSTIVKYIFTYL